MNIEEQVQELLRDVVGNNVLVVTDDTTASDVDGWDSLAHVNLLFALEADFGVRIPEDEWASFKTVGDINHYLRKATAAG